MGHWSNILLKSHCKPNGTRRYLNFSLLCTYIHKYIYIFFTRTEIARHLSSDLGKIILNIFYTSQKEILFKKLTLVYVCKNWVQNVKVPRPEMSYIRSCFFQVIKAQTIRLMQSNPCIFHLSSKLQTSLWNNF